MANAPKSKAGSKADQELEKIERQIAQLEKVTSRAGGATEASLVGPTRELANYRKLVDRVVDAFGDEIKASRWLSRPNPELNGETPLQVAERVGYDAEVLESLLTRIEHGVYF